MLLAAQLTCVYFFSGHLQELIVKWSTPKNPLHEIRIHDFTDMNYNAALHRWHLTQFVINFWQLSGCSFNLPTKMEKNARNGWSLIESCQKSIETFVKQEGTWQSNVIKRAFPNTICNCTFKIPRVEKFDFCLQFVGFSQKFRLELSKFGIQNQQWNPESQSRIRKLLMLVKHMDAQ